MTGINEYVINQGCAYLIEVEHFKGSFPWTKEPRYFVSHDNNVIREALEGCKFTVKSRKAKMKSDLEEKIKNIHDDVSKAEKGTCDALIIVISGYGDEGLVFCKDEEVNIYDLLWGTFKGTHCENLVGKPKLFLLQTCNHALYAFRGTIDTDSPGQADVGTTQNAVQMMPAEADFAFIQCLIPGTTPFRTREPIEGSMFITSFSKHIKNGITLNRVMTRTRRDIDVEMSNKECESVYKATSRKLPLMSSTLTKIFCFRVK